MQIVSMKQKHYRRIIKVAKALHPFWFDKNAITYEIPADIKVQKGFVAVENGKVVGFITYTSNNAIGELGWIGVDPNYQKKGIGRKLVKKIEQEFKKAGINEMIVETVGWSKPAYPCYATTRKFYRAVGFRNMKLKGEVKKTGKWTWQMCTFSKKLS